MAFFFVRSSAPHQNFGGLTQSETSSSGRDAFGFLSRDPPPPALAIVLARPQVHACIAHAAPQQTCNERHNKRVVYRQ